MYKTSLFSSVIDFCITKTVILKKTYLFLSNENIIILCTKKNPISNSIIFKKKN